MVSANRQKRVLIIEPRSPGENVFSMYGGLPLMGPLYMGTMLKRMGCDVTFIKENLLKKDVELNDLDADVLLLSCLTSTVERGYELASVFKRRNPRSLVVMGGPHVTFLTEEALRYADVVVRGEGETVIEDIVRYGSAERVVEGPPVADLDTLPVVDFSIMRGHRKLKVFPLMTSRGCPHACNFCSVTAMFGRKYRFQSAERVLEELEQCRQDIAFIYDDNFIAHKKRSHRLLDLLLRRKSKVPRWLTCQTTTRLARDEVLMEKMVRAGFSRLYVGFESIHDSALKCLNKHHGSSDVVQSIKRFHHHGLRVHGMFIMGTDADTEDTIRSTSEFVRKAKINTVQYMVLTPLPGTPLFYELQSQGRIIHTLWRYYDGAHVVFQPKLMTPYRLQECVMDSFGDFYSVFQSAGEALETMAECASRLVAHVSIKRFGMPAIENALFKLGGTVIVKQWLKHNRDYFDFLKLLPARLKGLGTSA
jgi:anaerobic magnesium-protoporphyrin IX monomethyl ester cyclase